MQKLFVILTVLCVNVLASRITTERQFAHMHRASLGVDQWHQSSTRPSATSPPINAVAQLQARHNKLAIDLEKSSVVLFAHLKSDHDTLLGKINSKYIQASRIHFPQYQTELLQAVATYHATIDVHNRYHANVMHILATKQDAEMAALAKTLGLQHTSKRLNATEAMQPAPILDAAQATKLMVNATRRQTLIDFAIRLGDNFEILIAGIAAEHIKDYEAIVNSGIDAKQVAQQTQELCRMFDLHNEFLNAYYRYDHKMLNDEIASLTPTG